MRMSRRSMALGAAAAVAAAGTGRSARAQTWPARPITLVVPFAAGGTTDILARLIATPLSEQLGQQIIVENRTGAGGATGALEVVRATPDGYTLLFQSPATLVTIPTASKVAPYNTLDSFTHIYQLCRVPNLFCIRPSLEAKTMGELAQYAKASPGKVTYGSAGPGTTQQIACELFKLRNGGLDILHVPYKGGAAALQDVLGGVIDIIAESPATLLPLHKEGKVRALAVLSEQRLADAPDIPTSAESGSPGVIFESFQLISGPAGLPKEIAAQVGDGIRKSMNQPEIVAKFKGLSIMPELNSSPEAATAFAVKQQGLFREIISAAQISLG